MLIALPLRNIEKRMNLEVSVLSEGKEFDPEAGPPMQQMGG